MGDGEWFYGILLGVFLGYISFSPSNFDKDQFRLEGYNRARAEIAATQPATQSSQPATSAHDKLSELEK